MQPLSRVLPERLALIRPVAQKGRCNLLEVLHEVPMPKAPIFPNAAIV